MFPNTSAKKLNCSVRHRSVLLHQEHSGTGAARRKPLPKVFWHGPNIRSDRHTAFRGRESQHFSIGNPGHIDCGFAAQAATNDCMT